MATLLSRLVTSIWITGAATHDAEPTTKLLALAAELGVDPVQLLADLAYGTGKNVRECAKMGVEILTKQGANGRNAIPKKDFTIDLDAMTVTCPQGHIVSRFTMVKAGDDSDERVASFQFGSETCRACPLAEKCSGATREGRGRNIKLSLYEPELQRTKAFNARPEAKRMHRKRSVIECIISHVTRMGLRTARYFGLPWVRYQAYLTAAAYNLKRIATLLASA